MLLVKENSPAAINAALLKLGKKEEEVKHQLSASSVSSAKINFSNLSQFDPAPGETIKTTNIYYTNYEVNESLPVQINEATYITIIATRERNTIRYEMEIEMKPKNYEKVLNFPYPAGTVAIYVYENNYLPYAYHKWTMYATKNAGSYYNMPSSSQTIYNNSIIGVSSTLSQQGTIHPNDLYKLSTYSIDIALTILVSASISMSLSMQGKILPTITFNFGNYQGDVEFTFNNDRYIVGINEFPKIAYADTYVSQRWQYSSFFNNSWPRVRNPISSVLPFYIAPDVVVTQAYINVNGDMWYVSTDVPAMFDCVIGNLSNSVTTSWTAQPVQSLYYKYLPPVTSIIYNPFILYRGVNIQPHYNTGQVTYPWKSKEIFIANNGLQSSGAMNDFMNWYAANNIYEQTNSLIHFITVYPNVEQFITIPPSFTNEVWITLTGNSNNQGFTVNVYNRGSKINIFDGRGGSVSSSSLLLHIQYTTNNADKLYIETQWTTAMYNLNPVTSANNFFINSIYFKPMNGVHLYAYSRTGSSRVAWMNLMGYTDYLTIAGSIDTGLFQPTTGQAVDIIPLT
jgi:hypothetical protein